MSKGSSSVSCGSGCSGTLAVLLTVLFVGLKLTGYINWEWLWVLAPLWIYAILVAVMVVIALVIFGIILLLD